jgi:DNA-binding CsgD family transcriptional regulator
MGRTRQTEQRLTERQRQVLRLIAKGHTNTEIAEQLGISLAGAKWHVSDLLTRFGVETRDELAERWAEERSPAARLGRMWSALAGGLAIKPSLLATAGAVGIVGVGTAVGFAALGWADADDKPRPAPANYVSPTAAPTWIEFADCPITIPSNPYIPVPPHPAQLPDYYQAVWYGTDALWTMLPPAGAVWTTGVVQKSFWWSRDYGGEGQPLLSVSGRRLDAPGSFSTAESGTNAGADFGPAMLTGFDTPDTGCWEITGEYKGNQLRFIALVR